MATVSMLTMRTSIREELGIEQVNEVLTDVELNRRINASGNKLYNRLVKADQDYFLTSTSFVLAGSNTYTLPALYKLRGLEWAVNAAGDLWIDVPPHSFGYRNQIYERSFHVIGGTTLRIMPFSSAVGTFQLWYIPAYTAMVADTDTIETISGFERLVVAETCAWARNKQELDPSVFLAEVAKLEQEIDLYARDRQATGPRTVRDVRPSWNRRQNSTDYDWRW